ncbi:hypothetical protein OH77DRAFT_1064229 [Trametes cingulata]|nr:hypothetical protein OH77DRAFT_1064229 [Trametes cingulata]
MPKDSLLASITLKLTCLAEFHVMLPTHRSDIVKGYTQDWWRNAIRTKLPLLRAEIRVTFEIAEDDLWQGPRDGCVSTSRIVHTCPRRRRSMRAVYEQTIGTDKGGDAVVVGVCCRLR